MNLVEECIVYSIALQAPRRQQYTYSRYIVSHEAYSYILGLSPPDLACHKCHESSSKYSHTPVGNMPAMGAD
jgi:hypothetical protein